MNKVVIVTGAAGGVGRILVQELVKQGRRVIAMVLDEREEVDLRGKIPDLTDVVRCDLGKAEHIAPALAPVLADQRLELEAIVACAGIWPGAPLETSSLDEVRRTLEINTLAPLALLQATLPALRRSRGRVVFVSSISGRMPVAFNGAYGMSKFALEALADVARREIAAWGIHVTVIQPGPIKTGMTTGMIERLKVLKSQLRPAEQELYGSLYDGFGIMCEKGYPDASDPEEVAKAIIDTLNAQDPETRVQVGPIAEQVAAAAKTLPDLELDGIARSLISGAMFADK